MRTSRSSVWAVGLLLGMSGCAGVQQRNPASAPGGVLADAPSPSGVRGWLGRRLGGGYRPTVQSGVGAIPPAAAFPASSGGGWGGVYQFSRPPWVTRQPQRAPIFGMNRPGVPAGAKMSPAEINEAIARMTAGRRNDDQVLPVRNVDEPPAATPEPDREEPSILSRPIRLPEALADASEGDAPRDVAHPDPAAPAENRPADEAVSATPSGGSPAPEPDPLMADPIDDAEPVAAPPAMTSPDRAAMPRDVQDERLVRSSQLPPPPPIRPEPGVEPPVADPAPAPDLDPPKPEDAPKPAEAPVLEETPKPVDPPKPAESPVIEAPKAEEPPKPAEVPTPPEPPKVEEIRKPAETPPPGASPKVEGVRPEPVPTATPPVRDPRPEPAAQAAATEPRPADMAAVAAAQTQIYRAPVVSAFPDPAPRANRWSFWNWKSSKEDHGHHRHAMATAQSQPAQLPPATFPTSYESVWAKPLVPCPENARVPVPSAQAPTVAPSPQAGATAAEKAPCWLVDRLKARAHQWKAWKHEHICRHIQGFKAALKGGKCHDCEKVVTPSPQGSPRPTPQAAPSPQAKPSPQELPVIGGSRFGLY